MFLTHASVKRIAWFRAIELLVLFVGVPALMVWGGTRVRPLLVGALAAGFCFVLLWRDGGFDRSTLWNIAGLRGVARLILLRFAICAVLLTGLVWLLRPDQFFILPRTRPGLWAVIMVAYPLISVWPQELIYRAFFFHRYRSIFGEGAGMVIGSSVAFGLMHVIFQNWVAVVMTIVGGVFFGTTYLKSRSLLAVSFEHTLYGQLIFTIGLGAYFYTGTLRTMGG